MQRGAAAGPSDQEKRLTPRPVAHRERTLEMAQAFLAEVRRDLARATAAGCDLPPRLRSVHLRAGHATPEYRTLAIPTTPGADGPSPEILSGMIARYAAIRPPCCMILTLDGLSEGSDGAPRPILIAEARDAIGTRVFWMQGFRTVDGKVEWEPPMGGGWQDPGDQELILDLAFAESTEPAAPLPKNRPGHTVEPHLVS
jgi:hypothetical protein